MRTHSTDLWWVYINCTNKKKYMRKKTKQREKKKEYLALTSGSIDKIGISDSNKINGHIEVDTVLWFLKI